MNDDAELIAQTLQGRPAAFAVLVCKYQDRLYTALAHSLGHADDARDVVQDALVQAFVKLESFRQSSSFYTWLYRIAFNLAATRRRRKRPELSVQQVQEASGQEPVDDGPGPDQRIQREELRGQVRQALAQLSPEHREILVLREIDGCSYEAIAEILDLPVGTVRSRIFRARLEMREALREELIDDQG